MNASQTYHDLSQSIRTPIVALLNQQLADLLDLGLQAKQAHWNVKGRNFFGLHELFDKSAEELNESSDRVAERAVQLGGFAMGTLQAISGSSRLPAYPTDLVTGLGHVEVLVSALRKLAHTTRLAIDVAAGLGDADRADVFTEVSRSIDKLTWMIEAHLQADR